MIGILRVSSSNSKFCLNIRGPENPRQPDVHTSCCCRRRRRPLLLLLLLFLVVYCAMKDW